MRVNTVPSLCVEVAKSQLPTPTRTADPMLPTWQIQWSQPVSTCLTSQIGNPTPLPTYGLIHLLLLSSVRKRPHPPLCDPATHLTLGVHRRQRGRRPAMPGRRRLRGIALVEPHHVVLEAAKSEAKRREAPKGAPEGKRSKVLHEGFIKFGWFHQVWDGSNLRISARCR